MSWKHLLWPFAGVTSLVLLIAACESDAESTAASAGPGGGSAEGGGGMAGSGGIAGSGGASGGTGGTTSASGGMGGSSTGGAGGSGGGGSTNCVIYVNHADGNDGDDGTSWVDAKLTVQAGIDAAAAGGCDLWVAQGTYLPSTTDNRGERFVFAPFLAVYGGFDGTETMLSERDVSAHETVLSGDIGVPSDSSDNSFVVVRGAHGARIDGFTVRDGEGGGGIRVTGDFTVAACRILNNTALGAFGGAGSIGGNGHDGAGIHHSGGSLTVEDSHFEQNLTANGGTGSAIGGNGGRGAGIFFESGHTLTVTGSTFTNNTTGTGGTGGSISGNGGNGAAIAFAEGVMADINGCTFTGNSGGLAGSGGLSGLGGSGGAIAVYDGEIRVRNSTFTANTGGKGAAGATGGYGGAIEIGQDAAAEIRGCTFDGNLGGESGDDTSITGLGGAIILTGGNRSSVIVDNVFTGNQSLAGGAFVYRAWGSGDLTVASNDFVGNSANSGGAGWLDLDGFAGVGTITFVNAVFDGNSAVGTGGALQVMTDASRAVRIVNTTFEGNTADTGGAIYFSSTSVVGAEETLVSNSILWGNSATSGAEIRADGSGAFIEVDVSDMQGGCTPVDRLLCGTVLDTDPLFSNPAQGDLTLQMASPVIDQGDQALLPVDAADVDEDGNTSEVLPYDRAGAGRVIGLDVDLGAFEAP